MDKCEKCGGLLEAKIVHEHLDRHLVGISVVLIDSVSKLICKSCGADAGISIPDPEGLVAAVAVARVKLPDKLEAKDIKFLRRALRMSAKDLAESLGVTPETLSRWENDKDPIGPANEKLLRLIVGLTLSEKAPAIKFDQKEIASMRIQSVRPAGTRRVMCFKRVPFVNLKKDLEESWREEEKKAA